VGGNYDDFCGKGDGSELGFQHSLAVWKQRKWERNRKKKELLHIDLSESILYGEVHFEISMKFLMKYKLQCEVIQIGDCRIGGCDGYHLLGYDAVAW
jgi:hypothetical protein